MIDINLIRNNKELVKENIKKKFQDEKLDLVDEVEHLDRKYREVKLNGDNLRSERKTLSAQIGNLMKSGEKIHAEEIKQKVQEINTRLEENEALENELFSNIDNPDYLKDEDFEEFSELNDNLKEQDDNTIKKLLDGEL